MLPDLRGPIERRDAADAAAAIDLYIDIYGRLSQRMDAIAAHLDAVAPVEP
jgi:hypothetical protein